VNVHHHQRAFTALGACILMLASPSFAQDRAVGATPERAVLRTVDSPFGPAIKVTPARTAAAPAVAAVASPASVPATQEAKVAAVGEPKAPAAAKPISAVPTVWTLEAGVPLHSQLRGWAEQAGWQLEWKVPRSWIVPARTQFQGRFDEALERVVLSLTHQGKPLQLTLWEGNHVAEVSEVAPR
jgi:hypothetical protein